jgi:hypothetical protein
MREPLSAKVEDDPPVPAFSWRGSLSPFAVVPALVPAVALFVAPADVLDASTSLRAFTAWMGERVPNIAGHASGTSIPQVAQLVNCLIVAAAAVVALVFLVQTTLNYPYLYRRHVALGPHPLKTYAVGLVGPVVFVGALAVLVMMPGDPSWATGATQSRTLFYGFLAAATPYSTGLAVGASPLMLRLFIDAYLFSRPVTFRER